MKGREGEREGGREREGERGRERETSYDTIACPRIVRSGTNVGQMKVFCLWMICINSLPSDGTIVRGTYPLSEGPLASAQTSTCSPSFTVYVSLVNATEIPKKDDITVIIIIYTSIVKAVQQYNISTAPD